MAKNFNIRRSAANYTDNIVDASNRLSEILAGNHFIDMQMVPAIMNELRDMSLVNIEAAIDKAEATMIAAETLRDVFKNLKKWKETQKKLTHKDEMARRKDEQKKHRKTKLNEMMNMPERWTVLPLDDDDDAMDH